LTKVKPQWQKRDIRLDLCRVRGDDGRVVSPRALLSYVLCEARNLLDRSPEQVGAAIGMSGRTIRRLEDPEYIAQPRRTTLTTVAAFYGLDAQFVAELADWEDGEDALLAWMREQAGFRGQEFSGRSDEARQLAMLLARGPGRGNGEVPALGFGSGKTHAWAAVVHRLKGLELRSGHDEETDELVGLLGAFLSLDRRRRRLALALMEELRAAREAERSEA
jgi:hypothetical protein